MCRSFLMMVTKLSDFLARNEKFVDLEKEAEVEQNKLLIESNSLIDLCKSGVALKKLRAVHQRTSFGGKVEVKFAASGEDQPLPAHKLTPGDIVNVGRSNDHKTPIACGVVCKVGESSISVNFDFWDDEDMQVENRTFCLVQTVNDVTFRRWRNLVSFENNSDASEAVRFCSNVSRPVSVVHGPPGTGKTTTIVEIIRLAVKHRHKILVCAPSNVAVDNVVQRLIDVGVGGVIRVGHPARMHADLRRFCLDHVLKNGDQAGLIVDIRKEISELNKNRRKTRNEIKDLKKELQRRENAALVETFRNANVVCSTLTSATVDGPMREFLRHSHFDLVIIDECAQYLIIFGLFVFWATELACWSALLLGKKCILAGDHNQLAPTILSDEASKDGFSLTLMQRIVDEFPQVDLIRQLTVQYRMNESIMIWASVNQYSNRLVADQSVRNHLLKDLSDVEETEETAAALVLIDTAGCDMDEVKFADDESKANIGEVKLVYLHVKRLVEAGVSPSCIAAISPYNLQVQLIRMHVAAAYPGLSVRSVDGFQGQEREAVILSLVRSNAKREIGFLKDRRRINVAATRARRHLAVVCDSRCVSADRFVESLIDHITSTGIVKSGGEFRGEMVSLDFEVDAELLCTASASTSKAESKAETKKLKEKRVKK